MTTTTSVPTATSNNNSKPNNNNNNDAAITTANNNNNTTTTISLECSTNNITITDNNNVGNSMQQSSSTAVAAATTTTTTTSTSTSTAAGTGTVVAATTTITPATLLTHPECLTSPPLTNRAVTITPILNPALSLNSQNNFTRTMQTDEDFNIRFVNLVRLHKCLYDKKVPEYRNRDNQEKAWLQISKETKESVIHCKERWRNLRACLSRYIKQQTGNDPQHKPYYLTEHMAFLLPFLKSTRNSLDGNNSLATLFKYSQQQQQTNVQHQNNSITTTLQILTQPHFKFNNNDQEQLEVKHSLSDNEDEETIDAFDPAITASMHMQSNHHHLQRDSPPLSDTASANTMQNFIPDVQLSELRTPDGVAQDISFVNTHLRRDSTSHQHHHHNHEFGHEPKRIKTECHASEATTTAQLHMYAGEHADMEFFRSIMPDIAGLTPHQKRKLKIGILELIDDVVERYPLERSTNTTNVTSQNANVNAKTRRNSSRDWRK